MRIDDEDTPMDDGMLVYYQDELFTGEVVSKDASGLVVDLVTYTNGVQNGPQGQWYSDGTKEMEAEAANGIAVNDFRTWHKNGQLSEHSIFNSKGRRTRRQRWDQDGNLIEDKTYDHR
ncbi:toxin-antitoxin system YwqK family antitoxin [Streptomyces sp. NPDC002754]